MSIVKVKYDGVPVPVNIPDALNDVCEHIATVKRGRFGVITGHQSGTAGKDKCVRPTISDITFITNPRYDRYLERMQAAVSAVCFLPFVNSLTQSQYKEMKVKNGGENLEPAFDAAKDEVLASLAESLEGDGGDAHRMGHRLCYATFDAGDVPVKCHLATEKGDDGLMRRVERAELPILYVKCVRGPGFVGDSYAQVVAEFERIARREKVQFLQEGGPDFEPKLAGYKNLVPKPAAPR